MEQQVPEGYTSSKGGYWKFIIGFLIIIGLTVGGFFAWNKYFSPEAKYAREMRENYQKYLDFEANYEKALTEDASGGKTPEETLNMFIEALKDEDVELASKYFYLDTNEKSEYYLTQREWKEGLIKAKEEGRLNKIIDVINRSVIDNSHQSEESVWFTLDNQEGMAEYTTILKFNNYSGVWKIESM
jgi:hypothetical protein